MKTILFLCSLLVACATPPLPQQTALTLTIEEADIYEAVLRHQFNFSASPRQSSVGSYFVSIQRADPPEALLQRFNGDIPSVKRASEADQRQNWNIHKREAGELPPIFWFGPIRWIDRNTVEVNGGYYKTSLDSFMNTYRLVRTRNKWRWVEDTETMVSIIQRPQHLTAAPANGGWRSDFLC